MSSKVLVMGHIYSKKIAIRVSFLDFLSLLAVKSCLFASKRRMMASPTTLSAWAA